MTKTGRRDRQWNMIPDNIVKIWRLFFYFIVWPPRGQSVLHLLLFFFLFTMAGELQPIPAVGG